MKMWSVVPVIFLLLNTAESRTSPIDIIERNHHNDVLLSPENLFQSRDFADLKELTTHLKQIESNNLDDQRAEWNMNNDKYDINPRKIISMDTGDSDTFDDFDDIQGDEPDEVELNELTDFLSTLLKQPVWVTPLAIIDESPDNNDDDSVDLEKRKIFKRSRYYRRYPWKRQNSRSRKALEYDSGYLCTPSREDVFKLLVALHDVRQGNKTRTVNFCNRRRPVGTVFTNIRFLGRRK